MPNGKPRSEAWAEFPEETKLRLILNELDEFDGRIEVIARSIRVRLNWMLGLFVGVLLAAIGNLLILVVSR